ncbi:PREDICTED: plant UBX domain-containing protein 5-like isoform X2 [Tarenaya hassleriana]|uniref:plant UBX domain-containing protein 5-like isoform X2 n=1 Tax=Tarenaya hassleriana TaxID=28532 RepID=UPI00053C5727|nr:PREDICTED: plant UBX domain-containing protein 5-like isoform X2 [Tarenaya hassleriana]
MADGGCPPEKEHLIDYVCSETGTTRDTAIFYLQAYAWEAGSAIAALLEDNPSPIFHRLPADFSSALPPSPPPLRTETAEAENQPGTVQDPVGFFCECTGQCREAALFYLEGFKWNFEEAINGFHSNILPPLGDSISQNLPTDEAMAIDTNPSSEPPPSPPPPSKRLRSPSSPPEDSSFTFPKLEHYSLLEEQEQVLGDSFASDISKVVSAMRSNIEALGSMATTVNMSHKKVSAMKNNIEALGSMATTVNMSHKKDEELDEQTSIMEEVSSAPTPESTFDIELADGIKFIAKFNPRDRIRDVRDYVDSMRPGEPKDYKLLTKSSPRRELTDMDQTIEEAGINDSGLIQEYHRDSSTPTTGDQPFSAGADSPVIGLVEDPSRRAVALVIHLRDGSELELSFTYDKTIRDIHERVDKIRPYDGKAYHFLDSEARELRDMDQTIEAAKLDEPRLVQMDDY